MGKKHKKNKNIFKIKENVVETTEENKSENNDTLISEEIENSDSIIEVASEQNDTEGNVIVAENGEAEVQEGINLEESDENILTENDVVSTDESNENNVADLNDSQEPNQDNSFVVESDLTETEVIVPEESTAESDENTEILDESENEAIEVSEENVEFETENNVENESNIQTDSENKEETNAETENNSENQDDTTDEELKAKVEKEKAKAEKREKRKEWVKAHKLFIAISSIIFFVVVGILIGHFVSTANMVFIHNANDLVKASSQSKKSELKFKADITVDGDITLNGYSLDMDKYTLTVNGNLTIKSENLNIGKQLFLWSAYEKGGKIEVSGRLVLDSKETKLLSSVKADNVIILSDNAHISNTVEPKTADYTGIWFNRNETTDSVLGAYSSDTGHLTLDSQTKSNINTNITSTITLNGTANEIIGGEKVYLKDNSKSVFVSECSKLYISEGATWGGFDANSVQNYYFVQKLGKPELIIEKSGNTFEVHISHVDNADAYILTYEGLDQVRVPKDFGANYTTYILPSRDPSTYNLSVYAVSDNPDEFNDGDIASTKVEVYATLDKVQILSCEKIKSENGEQYILTIVSVKNALSYEIIVDGKTLNVDAKEEETIEIDLTSLINGVGTYNIRVTAIAKGTNYKNSDVELYSFVNTIKLVLGEIKESENEGKYTYLWDNIIGASAYEITYGEDGKKIITTENFIVLDESSFVSVRPLGKGYYKDGESVIINAPEIEPEIPIDPETPDLPNEDE